jgi:N-acetylmuramoyl-L-alanine amidase
MLLSIVLAVECHGRGPVMPLEKISRNHGLRMISPSSFSSPRGTFEFSENSRTFTLNKILLSLGFPTSRRLGKVCVDESDYRHHVKPLLAPPVRCHGKGMVVVLDAGHGGDDNGTVSRVTGAKEKDLNLDLCLRVAKILESNGCRVILTRSDDRKIPLPERSRIANRARASLFVAIHFNSSPNTLARGVETFTLPPYGQPPTYSTAGPISTKKLPGNDFDGANTFLGYCLQSSLVTTVPTEDRGVKHGAFSVLRGLRCPGALVECGFLSNADESVRISRGEYRDRLARAIAAAIGKFLCPP